MQLPHQSRTEELRWTVASTPWEAEIADPSREKARPDVQPKAPNHLSLGNHRARLKVPAAGEAAHLNLEWRRHDRDVHKRRFIIVNADTGATVPNVHRLQVTNERCELLFGPVDVGEYFFYYLPFELQGGWGGYGKDYLPPESSPDPGWLGTLKLNAVDRAPFVEAQDVEIEARTEFDSFFLMEVIATEKEKAALIASRPGRKFLLFPEDRKYPIRMLDNIPRKWILQPSTGRFEGRAARNEYYAFQVGLWALEDVEDVTVAFCPLKGKDYTLPTTAMTCFNEGGTDPSGKAFTKTVHVTRGRVQPLWIGLDLPESMPPGAYEGKVTIRARNAEPQELEVVLTVSSEVLADRGDGETWRHSRLRWLNSTVGIDDEPIAPYEPVKIAGNKLLLTGKEVAFAENGLPSAIKVYGEEVLVSPMRFTVVTAQGDVSFKAWKTKILKQAGNIVVRETRQESDGVALTTRSEVESDGWLKYFLELEARRDTEVSDIRLEIPFRRESSSYLSGMDLYGVETPDRHDARMDPLYDAFWVGGVKAGLYCELRGASYCGPMLYYGPIRDFYKPEPPESWNNGGRGGYRIRTRGGQRTVAVCSGPRELKQGERLVFECAFIITPVKPVNGRYELANRYFQNQYHPEPSDADAAAGVKVANLHHANEYNPFINYPFIAAKEMKGYMDRCHRKGIKGKIYCTTRELTTFAAEIWALRSLGEEILTGGPGKGYPWQREHLVDHYTPQWYQYLGGSLGADAAVLTSVGVTRWYNYYIEGLQWLVQNVGIDGIYIDAAAYDREIVKRISKAMAQAKPGCLLDLHEGRDCILRYLEFFPYLDRIWLGESIAYDKISPAAWLVCVSGIPFGFMGDMLQDGGNPWRGAVYGLTSRYGWTTDGTFCDPRSVWKLWDRFGIADSTMVGYWEAQPAVWTSRPDVRATGYLKKGKMLVSIASWVESPCSVTLSIDFKRAGLDPAKVHISAPYVAGFQPEKTFDLNEAIPVEPARGWLLVVEEKDE